METFSDYLHFTVRPEYVCASLSLICCFNDNNICLGSTLHVEVMRYEVY